MAKDIMGNGLAYDQDVDGKSIYILWIENKIAFSVVVDNADPELKIVITGNGKTLETNGRAGKGMHEVGGSDTSPGDLKDHIDGMSIQMYIYPRIMHFIAELYF